MKIIIFWRSFALGPFQQNERIQFFDQNVGNLVLVEKNVLAVKPVHPTCNSLLMLINLGWLNSIFPFRASPLIFRINTASLTCLVNGSLQIFSTFIFKSIVSPLCFSCWCANIKLLGSFLSSLSLCSTLREKKFLWVSPTYLGGWVGGFGLVVVGSRQVWQL